MPQEQHSSILSEIICINYAGSNGDPGDEFFRKKVLLRLFIMNKLQPHVHGNSSVLALRFFVI